MRALHLYAGPGAMRHIRQHGLQPGDIRTVAGAAGGPKGLILGPLDRWIFGKWLPQADTPVDLIGASIGAWRMATACLDDCVTAFARLEHDYIRQDYALEPGQSRPTPDQVSELFGSNLQAFYGQRVGEVLSHPRYRLHVLTARGRHLLGREHRLRTPLGYLGAFLTNTVHRKAMGAWLERVVFSTPGAALPFATQDYRTRQVPLATANFHAALQASCSIPFMLRAVHDIPGAPPGAYWDGGITDYHLHLNYAGVAPPQADVRPGLVLYPHFQRAVVPGWLDKGLKWRHKPTGFLDNLLLLAPNPQWVARLPRGKLPDRNDFIHHRHDLAGRIRDWSAAASASEQLAEEFVRWVEAPDLDTLQPL
ncbi:MAG: phospholipase [Burkholderiaceae bacterium]